MESDHPLGNITAAVLAGGLGTRLRDAVPDTPKVLARVAGRPFLAHVLDALVEAGVSKTVLCTGHKAELVAATFGDMYGTMPLAYSQEKEARGTAGALREALALFDTETILVLNGDSYCTADLAGFRRWHAAKKATASILLTRMAERGRFGAVETDDADCVVRFAEKGSQGSGWVNAGIYLLARPLVASIPEGRAVSIEREMFPEWLQLPLYGFQSSGTFVDIGTPESYATADTFMRSQRGCHGN
jgi:D-glycero-alpha-D-manno-heptose 1-phosphate guanylyltransferase